jgi:hypothetical protein
MTTAMRSALSAYGFTGVCEELNSRFAVARWGDLQVLLELNHHAKTCWVYPMDMPRQSYFSVEECLALLCHKNSNWTKRSFRVSYLPGIEWCLILNLGRGI